MAPSEEYLVKDLSSGSREAFTAVYEQYAYSMLNFASQLLGNMQDAEDVVADVFVNFWELRARFNSINNVKAFLYRSVRNACLDVLKREKTRKQLKSLTDANEPEINIPDEIFIRDEMKKRLRDQIERLPPQCKAIFVMSVYEDKKTAEIARILNIQPRTVTNQKARALELIRSGWKVLVTSMLVIVAAGH